MFELDLLEELDDSEDFDSDVETLGVTHSTTSPLPAVFHWYLTEYWGSVLGVEIWT